jgi:carbon-monoxide dehydrogenase small subunit
MTSNWPAIEFVVNGDKRSVHAPPMKRLLDVLREDLHLTGAKEGCGEGECGSCSVRMNGELVNSCLIPILQAQDARIQTVEGLAIDGDLLANNPHPTMTEIREGLAGNLCRCTGFKRIFDSVISAAVHSSESHAR